MIKNTIIKSVVLVLSLVLFLSACNGYTPSPSTPPQASPVVIHFDSTGGSFVDSIEAYAEEEIFEPADPFREGYRFMGWEHNGELFVFNVMPKNTIILKARWARYFTISFIAGEGATPVEPIQRVYGEFIGRLPITSRPGTGYVFNGWVGAPAFMPESNIILIASWISGFLITFETGEGATEVDAIALPAGSSVAAPQNIPRRTGYRFLRWELSGRPFTFGVMPNSDIILTAAWTNNSHGWINNTNLPAMMIDVTHLHRGNTASIREIVRKRRDLARISIDSDKSDHIIQNIPAEFHGRGNGSWYEPYWGPSGYYNFRKRGYRIRFERGYDQGLFGHANSRHWVLMAGANFNDTTMVRYKLALDIARENLDGIRWTSAAEWIDLYINGRYHGVYVLLEHVREDNSRVDVRSEGVPHSQFDTGFVLEHCVRAAGGQGSLVASGQFGRQPDEHAGWNPPTHGSEGLEFFRINPSGSHHPVPASTTSESNRAFRMFPFAVDYPDASDYNLNNPAVNQNFRNRINFIQDWVDRTYNAVFRRDFVAFSELADVCSFVDMFILHELTKNTDTGWSSFNLAKSPGGLLRLDAPWDFDATAGRSRGESGHTGIYVADTVWHHSHHTASRLMYELYRMPEFRALINARWQEVSSGIRRVVIETLNDDFLTDNRIAFGNNLRRWQYHYLNQTAAEQRWVEHTTGVRNWFVNRINWLDGEWVV